MKWEKKGLIFDPKNNDSEWINSYAALPVCHLTPNNRLRIYFSTRDDKNRSVLTYLDTDPENPKDIKYTHKKSILPLGPQGSFDDNGIMASSIVEHNNKIYLYYIGWNPQVTVSYRLSIGLAISHDGGATFEKFSVGPILDRDMDEPFFNTAPYVIKENGKWKMWYVSCTRWKNINNWPEPFYNIKYAESEDGIKWQRQNQTCIDYDSFTDAIGKPCVFKEDGIYKMLYSFRNASQYRTNPDMSYRVGYAESMDGKNWTRKDNQFDLKSNPQSWETIMQEYCSTYVFKNKRYLIYNGNGFGESGFGYAILN